MNDITLTVYKGMEASVNAYLFTDNESAILVDCLRNSEEAILLSNVIKRSNKRLQTILITHGHADHYIGINILQQTFPNAKIVVTRQEIKDDIIEFSKWMESVGWLEKEPAMKPKSAVNPDGFDYEKHIAVLKAKELKLANGAVLELNSEYNAAECQHLTTIYSKDLNAFFTGDFCYNGVHIWLAVDKQNLVNWKEQLNQFKSDFNELQPRIFPGHGNASDAYLFDEVIQYIAHFEEIVATSGSRSEAMKRMNALYPNHLQADFLLLYSVNHFIPE